MFYHDFLSQTLMIRRKRVILKLFPFHTPTHSEAVVCRCRSYIPQTSHENTCVGCLFNKVADLKACEFNTDVFL